MKKNIKNISINNLLFDHENARYGGDIVENQREAISRMFQVKDMGKKILKLASHITEKGIDPTELPLVIPVEDKNNSPSKYIVTEGNRRILAVKLLRNPDLSPSDSCRRSIEQITSPEIKLSLSNIQCSIVEDRSVADLWIDIKHTGENEGVGRVNWDGAARDAFRARSGKTKTVGRQILDYIDADKAFSSELKKKIHQVDITNLTRLFQGSPAKKAFGLIRTNGIIKSSVPLNEFREIVEHVVALMLEDDFNVKQIYHKADQEKFIKNRIPPSIKPDAKNLLSESQSWQLSNLDVGSLTKEQKQGSNPSNKSKKTSVKSKPLSKHRLRLIDFSLKIDNKRINKIYEELKKQLSVHDSPNAVSVLFRVFLELTCDAYIKTNKPRRKDNEKLLTCNDGLRHKVENIAHDLEKNTHLSKSEAMSIRKSASTTNELVSVDSLHKYVHASMLSPIPTELNILMDNWAPFFKAIWK